MKLSDRLSGVLTLIVGGAIVAVARTFPEMPGQAIGPALLANLLMLPLGWMLIKLAKNILHVPRAVLMPVILLFCGVGAFAMNNSVFDIGVMLGFGLLAFFMEANAFPIAPTILGMVLGGMLEQNFVTSMIKADGRLLAFFDRPIAAGLGVATIIIWTSPLAFAWSRGRRQIEI